MRFIIQVREQSSRFLKKRREEQKKSFTAEKRASFYEKRELTLANKSESCALALRNVTLSKIFFEKIRFASDLACAAPG